ncbi:type VII secretion protein EccB [Streptomyces sp. NPDC058955]|uniref:type VII secretion protein EccB n=1 Tax=unclassified Streptomyces TaxID=2593676 RepID=UPI00365B91CB
MQSKRDQVQAHLFLMSRLTSGMLRANPDDLETPGGRTGKGMTYGLLVAVFALVVAALWGLFSPGTPSTWRTEGTLVLEKGTGNRYVYSDGRLRPLLNHASALLLLGSAPTTTTVAPSATRSAPHGPAIGIPGAPDHLPAPADLVTDAWRLCSSVTTETSGRTVVRTRLALGTGSTGRPLGAREGLLLQGPDGRIWLVWAGERFLLDAATGARTALGYGSAAPRPVSDAFLGALPAGPDLRAPGVPGRGSPGPDLDGLPTRIGQLFAVRAPGGETRYHLLRREGLVPLDATRAALVLGDPATRSLAHAGRPPTVRPLGTDAVQGHLAPLVVRTGGEGTPAAPPRLVEPSDDSQPCAVVRPSDGKGMGVSVSLAPDHVPEDHVTVPPADRVVPACLPVDRIEIPPGRGALVQALSSVGTQMGDTVFLVTDAGVRYPVASAQALAALGYTGADVRGLPSGLLMTLPTGVTLDPEVAGRAPAAAEAPPRRTCPGLAQLPAR